VSRLPAWILKSVVEAMHDALLAEHGGAAGVRDGALLESALPRPANRHAYGEPDIFDLAAAYAFGLVRNHPFVDGNKRTAFMTAYVFLRLNGQILAASEIEATTNMLDLASNAIDESAFANWLRRNTRPAA
jgi:death on curing protein